MKRPDIVHRIANVLHRIAPNAQAILYGSEARGDARRIWENMTTPFTINVMKEGIVL